MGVYTYGQAIVKNKSNNIHIPQEKIFVHYNTSFFVNGESIYYKIYCLDSKTNMPSLISKIAYIELIGKNDNIIFKHKIKLKSGLGQGDFFIPTSVLSGNYKLIAYTQWMKNSEIDSYFQGDISIINPFQENQNEVLKATDSSNSLETSVNRNFHNIPISSNSPLNNDLIQLKLNKHDFSSREKVSIDIIGLHNPDSYGNYSVSIRKINPIDFPQKLNTHSFLDFFKYAKIEKPLLNSQELYLPELRGEIFSGKVTIKKSNLPAANRSVSMSIPGKNYIFKIANTNSMGVFYFNLYEDIENPNAIFQVISENKESFEITLEDPFPINYNDLKFSDFKISEEIKDYLLNQSIYSQIENAYKSIKPDNFLETKKTPLFYGSKAKEFILDDYTRFPTIKETIVEIINSVYTKKSKGEYSLHVRISNDDTTLGNYLALVLVDGNLIQNQSELVFYNPKNIKKINVVSEGYVYGGKIYEGIISMETFDGTYQHNISGDYTKTLLLDLPQTDKVYYNQKYSDDGQYDRIPDYRSQLLWEPNFDLNKNESNITFYTSDNLGDYEINLEGFTNDGKPISIREIFKVE